MYIERPLPFYATYPYMFGMDQERDQERDMQVMKSYYSQTAAGIQNLVEQECDRLEYDGSMMFDEYPDKLMMELLARKIEEQYLDQMADRDREMETQELGRRQNGLRDLIGVLLYNEMYCRRCRRRRRRRYY